MGKKLFCLICCRREQSNSFEHRLVELRKLYLKCFPLSGKECESHQSNLVAFFVAKIILDLHGDVYEKLLISDGSPSNWGIVFCQKCFEVVKAAFNLYEKITRLIEKFEETKDLLRSAIIDSNKTYQHCSLRREVVKINSIRNDESQARVWTVKLDYRNSNKNNYTETLHSNKCNDVTVTYNTNKTVHKKKDTQCLQETVSEDNSNTAFADDKIKEITCPQTVFDDGGGSPFTFKMQENKDKSQKASRVEEKESIVIKLRLAADLVKKKDLFKSNKAIEFKKKPRKDDKPKTDLRIRKKYRRKQEKYKCTEENCTKYFWNEARRDGHIRLIHQGNHKPYLCEIEGCPKAYRSFLNLQIHKQTFHRLANETISFICESCGKVFFNKSAFSRHTSQQHPKKSKSHKCSLCHKLFCNAKRLEVHLSRHEKAETVQKCPSCPMEFFSGRQLYDHCKQSHKNGEELIKNELIGWKPEHFKRMKCPHCSKEFGGKYILSSHIKAKHTNEFRYKCERCPSGFIDRSAYDRHLRSHTGEKPFTCSICGKGMTRNADLRRHMRLHTGEKPFKCGICEERFTDGSLLSKHKKKAHINGDNAKDKFDCKVCGKQFIESTVFNAHCKMHDEEKIPKEKIIKPISARKRQEEPLVQADGPITAPTQGSRTQQQSTRTLKGKNFRNPNENQDFIPNSTFQVPIPTAAAQLTPTTADVSVYQTYHVIEHQQQHQQPQQTDLHGNYATYQPYTQLSLPVQGCSLTMEQQQHHSQQYDNYNSYCHQQQHQQINISGQDGLGGLGMGMTSSTMLSFSTNDYGTTMQDVGASTSVATATLSYIGPYLETTYLQPHQHP